MDSQSLASSQYEEKLEALHQHANKLADATSLEEIRVYSKEALENTVRPGILDYGELGFVDGNVIKYALTTNFPEIPLDGLGIIARAARTGETQLVNDTRKDDDFMGIHMGENNWLKLDDNTRERYE